jgi:hypothetical protein
VKKSLLLLLSICVLYLLSGCGSGGASTTPPPPVATHFSVTAASSTQTAGTTFNITVTALDHSDNVATTYSGTVHFTSTDVQSLLPPNSTLTNGTGAFSATLKTAGSQTITATDAAKASISGTSNPITVSHSAAATHFVVTAPSNAIAGTAFNITVTAFDASNNQVANYSGTTRFTSTDAQALLPSNATLTNGVANFSATLKSTGTQTVTATDTVTSSIVGTSNSINVSNNQGSSLSITSGTPPSGEVGIIYDPRLGPTCTPGSYRCFCVYLGPLLGYSCHISLYGFPLTATGGVPPFAWTWAAVPASSSPPGLTIESVYSSGGSTRCCVTLAGIGGIPTTAGTYDVIVTVTDSASPPAQASSKYAIAIAAPPPPLITTPNAPTAGVNLPYSFTFTASGGEQPLTWSEAGALPQGLTLGADGVLSGTPSVTGSFPITVTVQDSAGQNTLQNFTVQVFLHGFAPTGSMGSARFNLTATSLNAGMVLAAGGQDASGNTLATAELYDPSGGTFAPTGSMGSTRSFHTATSLGNGHVLIIGGDDGGGNPLASAELYDPGAGTFSATGSMLTARVFHTAALVASGRRKSTCHRGKGWDGQCTFLG